jgi:hypothetical protein
MRTERPPQELLLSMVLSFHIPNVGQQAERARRASSSLAAVVGVILVLIFVWTAVARHRFHMARLDGPSDHPARQAAPFQSGIKLPHSIIPTLSGSVYHQFFTPQHIFCVIT